MIIEQIYTGCLSHAAYYIESDGEAAIVDPLREVQTYIVRARKHKAVIKYILETHFHADFVSGHLELRDKTGGTIVYGPGAKPSFPAHIAVDGEVLSLGRARIRIIHTPGHTMESSCFLLIDEHGKEEAIFTGDTLFIGDVGRPDLAQKINDSLTKEKLASLLYDSLHEKILPLADNIVVYPGHGAGSACGKNISASTTDTLGHQKILNYGLNRNIDKETFIKNLLEGLEEPPAYFPSNVLLNIRGYEKLESIMLRGLHGWTANEFQTIANQAGCIIIDTRKAEDFRKAFIPNSINIGIDGNFASWVGDLVTDIKQNILIVADLGREEEVVTRLARVGFDHCLGFLKGGFSSWLMAGKEMDNIRSISPEDLASSMKKQPVDIIDVRASAEFNTEHLKGAVNIPLNYINNQMHKLDRNKTYYVHCASGYRSMAFISILRARGYFNMIDVTGGLSIIKKTRQFGITDYIKQALLL